jgi:hypothetical protein
MAINFPNTPNLNETHVVGNVTYTWNGTAWKVTNPIGVQGVQGTQGLQGVQGTQGIQGVTATAAAYLEYFEDFIANADAIAGWTSDTLNGGTVSYKNLFASHPGALTVSSTTAANSLAKTGFTSNILTNTDSTIQLGTVPTVFEMMARFSHSSPANGTIDVSLMDDMTNYANIVGINISSLGFRLRTSAASSGTFVNSSSPIVADQWHKVKIRATTSLVTLYLDDVEVASTTSTIPTSGLTLMVQTYSGVSGGSAAPRVDLDWVRVYVESADRFSGGVQGMTGTQGAAGAQGLQGLQGLQGPGAPDFVGAKVRLTNSQVI